VVILFSLAYILISITEETRIRWIQTQTRAETLLARIREVINSGIFKIEEALSHLFALLSGGWGETKGKSAEAYETTKGKVDEGQEYLQKKASDSGEWAHEKAGDASGWARQKVHDAKEVVGEKVKVSGQKIKGEL